MLRRGSAELHPPRTCGHLGKLDSSRQLAQPTASHSTRSHGHRCALCSRALGGQRRIVRGVYTREAVTGTCFRCTGHHPPRAVTPLQGLDPWGAMSTLHCPVEGQGTLCSQLPQTELLKHVHSARTPQMSSHHRSEQEVPPYPVYTWIFSSE